MSITPRVYAKRGVALLFEYSAFLGIGALSALYFANTNFALYHRIVTEEVHFIVNDVLMAFFFFIAAKEIREASLPGGKLADLKSAALPLMATVGGMAVPALIYYTGAQALNPALSNGWAIPMATDIAFSYLLAKIIFGVGHVAIPFLLLLAIADDAGGLLILAVFYPAKPLNVMMFSLILFAIACALFMYKVLKVQTFWWYLIPGAISWIGFYLSGLHPALSLVPLAWCMPHEQSDMGFYAEESGDIITVNGQEAHLHKTDTLNQFAHWWKRPVEVFLGFFGFVNAGVEFTSIGTGTILVLLGLVVGKPLGIILFTRLGTLFGLRLPSGLQMSHIAVLGSIAGIGFTVALFVSTVAFSSGPLQEEVKTGALLSILSALPAIALAKALRIREE